MRLLQLRSILLATDLQPGSRPAERSAVKLAIAADARLSVVHVVPDEASEMTLEERHERLDRISESGVDCDARLLHGDVIQLVLEAQAEAAADTVILGPRRADAPNPGPLGSVAYALVGRANVPSLIVPRELTLPLTRVMVAVDLTDGGRTALDAALTWTTALRHSKRSGLRTTLNALYVDVRGQPHPLCADDMARLRHEIEGESREAASWGDIEARFECTEGKDAAETILDRQLGEDADLLVIGTRAETPRSGDPLGSVSDRVTRWAARPVLLVPPRVSASPAPARRARRSHLRA